MAGFEVRSFEKHIASLLVEKWGRECRKLVGFMRSHMAMTMVRSNTLLMRGARIKHPKWISFVNGAALEDFPGLRELGGGAVPSAG